jgi:Lon-like protease
VIIRAAYPLQVARPRLGVPSRRTASGLVLLGSALLFAVLVALWLLPSKDYIFLPDRAHPVAPLVNLDHTRRANGIAGGGIYYVDVFVRKATLLEQLFGGLHEGADVEPANSVLPPGMTEAQRADLEQREMHHSQQVALAVALRAAGYKVKTTPTGALVSQLVSGAPALGRLEPTDVIVAVDGRRVRSPAGVRAAMSHVRVGQRVTFTVERGLSTKLVRVRTVADAAGSKRAVVGVFLEPSEDFHFPIGISIDAGSVGGPSAGLAFALDALQELGRNVDHGHRVAATGEIFMNGDVGPIGGIKQKTIGAREAGVDTFLVPAGDNARDARKYAHGLRIIPVESFQQALHALATLPPNPPSRAAVKG